MPKEKLKLMVLSIKADDGAAIGCEGAFLTKSAIQTKRLEVGAEFSSETKTSTFYIVSPDKIDFLQGDGCIAKMCDAQLVFFNADYADFGKYASPLVTLTYIRDELRRSLDGKKTPIVFVGITNKSLRDTYGNKDAKHELMTRLGTLHNELSDDKRTDIYLSVVNLEEGRFNEFGPEYSEKFDGDLDNYWEVLADHIPLKPAEENFDDFSDVDSLSDIYEPVEVDSEEKPADHAKIEVDTSNPLTEGDDNPSTSLLSQENKTSPSFFARYRPRPFSSKSRERRLAVRLAMSVLVTGGLFPLPLMVCAYASYELEKKVDNRLFRKKEFRG